MLVPRPGRSQWSGRCGRLWLPGLQRQWRLFSIRPRWHHSKGAAQPRPQVRRRRALPRGASSYRTASATGVEDPANIRYIFDFELEGTTTSVDTDIKVWYIQNQIFSVDTIDGSIDSVKRHRTGNVEISGWAYSNNEVDNDQVTIKVFFDDEQVGVVGGYTPTVERPDVLIAGKCTATTQGSTFGFLLNIAAHNGTPLRGPRLHLRGPGARAEQRRPSCPRRGPMAGSALRQTAGAFRCYGGVLYRARCTSRCRWH